MPKSWIYLGLPERANELGHNQIGTAKYIQLFPKTILMILRALSPSKHEDYSSASANACSMSSSTISVAAGGAFPYMSRWITMAAGISWVNGTLFLRENIPQSTESWKIPQTLNGSGELLMKKYTVLGNSKLFNCREHNKNYATHL